MIDTPTGGRAFVRLLLNHGINDTVMRNRSGFTPSTIERDHSEEGTV